VARIERAQSVEEAVQRLLPVSRKPGTGGPRSAAAAQDLREQNRLNQLLDLRLQKTRASIKVTPPDALPSLDRDAVNLLVREHGTALAAVRQARDLLKSASPAQAVVILRFFCGAGEGPDGGKRRVVRDKSFRNSGNKAARRCA
jgi:hypothetical protein